jgi:branched-chain amino acid transport system permease protein
MERLARPRRHGIRIMTRGPRSAALARRRPGAAGAGPAAAIRRPWRAVGLLAILVLAAACSEVDVEQARVCEQLLPALEGEGAAVEVLGRDRHPEAEHGVVIRYRAGTAAGAAEDHWVACRFAGGGFAPDRLQLTGVATDRRGAFSDIQLFMLRRFWLGRFESLAGVRGGAVSGKPSVRVSVLYFLQQAINALALSCVYGLLAVAYTLVFGLVGRINLAFGELAMIGAYVTLLGVHLLTLAGGIAVPVVLVTVLGFAAAFTAAYGRATEYVVFRPLRGSPSQAVLIATVGLAIFLQEFVRLSQGTRERWLQPVLGDVHVLAAADGFTLVVNNFQVLIVAVMAALVAVHRRLVERSRFGLAWQACAQDPGMAVLCGIDAGRTAALTFVLSGAYAGVAGWVIMLHYGGISFYMGTVLGFKALTAAIVGGIGSVPGAVLGGLFIGLVETFWSGYLTVAYRDLAVFGLLAAVLIFRPHGLVARPGIEKLPGPGAPLRR